MSWLWKKILGTDSEVLERLAKNYGISEEEQVLSAPRVVREHASRYEGEVDWQQESFARGERRARSDLIKILHALLDASGSRRTSKTPFHTPANSDALVHLQLGRSQILMLSQGQMDFCVDVGLMKFVASKGFPPSAPVEIVVGTVAVEVRPLKPKWAFKELDSREFFTSGEYTLRREMEVDGVDGEEDDEVVPRRSMRARREGSVRRRRMDRKAQLFSCILRCRRETNCERPPRATTGSMSDNGVRIMRHPNLDYSEFEAVMRAHEDITIMKGSADIAWRTGVFDFDVDLQLLLEYSMWADGAAKNERAWSRQERGGGQVLYHSKGGAGYEQAGNFGRACDA